MSFSGGDSTAALGASGPSRVRVLVAAGDEAFIEQVEQAMHVPPDVVVTAETAAAAISFLRKTRFDVVLVVDPLPDMTSCRFATAVHTAAANTAVAMVVDSCSPSMVARLARHGVSEFFSRDEDLSRMREVFLRSIVDGEESSVVDSRTDWQQTMDAITDPVFVTDGADKVLRANCALLQRLGVKEERSLFAADILRGHVLEGDGLQGEWPPREPRSWEAALSGLGGEFNVSVFPRVGRSGVPSTIVYYLKDISRERRMRARMMQTEKLTSLGQLVSGVAHELNNPLAAVQGLAELVLEDLQDTNTASPEDILTILEQARRASDIVRNLLQFSRQTKTLGESFSLNEAVRASVALMRFRLTSQSIDIRLDLDDDLPLLFGVLQQVEQVAVNLLMNAYQALQGRGGGGLVRISTVRTDSAVQLIVEDDGPGVRPEHVERVFEPFFTTREVGGGTGLGLSASYGIVVNEYGGEIYLDTTYTGGARFVVSLPTGGAGQTHHVPAIIDDQESEDARILIVDSDRELLDVMASVLDERGLEVVAVSSGEEAIAAIQTSSIDLIIVDNAVTVDERRLIDIIRERFSENSDRLVMTAVYDDEGPPAPEAIGQGHDAVLVKPFSTDRLVQCVTENLRRDRVS